MNQGENHSRKRGMDLAIVRQQMAGYKQVRVRGGLSYYLKLLPMTQIKVDG